MNEFIENFQAYQSFMEDVKKNPEAYSAKEIVEYFYILDLHEVF